MSLSKSWVASANAPDIDYPLNNLPYGVFLCVKRPPNEATGPHCCVAIGDYVFDVTAMEDHDNLDAAPDSASVFDHGSWNKFMLGGPAKWAEFRDLLNEILCEGSPYRSVAERYLIPREQVIMLLPFAVSEYTDFYSSRCHATNVGTMFRGAANALPPNWLHMPIGYNGRASSVVVSGTAVRRPWGQLMDLQDATPRFAPCVRFDMELEMGAIVGVASNGPLSVQQADDNIFGYVLLNDWSARDIQAWEYQPLGPFQAKATATSISPWIVTKAALEPFRSPAPPREFELLDYLREPGPMGYDIGLDVSLAPDGQSATTIARTNYDEMYYSAAQQLAHHSSSGCPMNVGDLLGSGTISGAQKHERGSMLELCWGGKEPLVLDSGEIRCFLEDGDTVTLRGAAQGDSYKIGFGECVGTVLAALDDPYK